MRSRVSLRRAATPARHEARRRIVVPCLDVVWTPVRRAGTLVRAGLSEGPKGHVMRRFVMGLLLGWASMYWYAYQKDVFFQSATDWFAHASADPDAKAKIDKMTSRTH